MNSLKDRISEKLSELFSDSPSHAVVDQRPQARLFSKEGRSLSSISPFLQLSFNKRRSVERIDDSKPIDSNSFFWRSKSFPLRDKPLERNSEYGHETEDVVSRISAQESKELFRACPENGDSFSERSNASDLQVFVDAPDLHSSRESIHNL